MFLIIPLIVIFLSFAYLQLQEEATLFEEISVYIIVLFTIILTLILYKKIKQNMKQQEINNILIEIEELKQKLEKEKDEKRKEFISKKISKLKNEIKS